MHQQARRPTRDYTLNMTRTLDLDFSNIVTRRGCIDYKRRMTRTLLSDYKHIETRICRVGYNTKMARTTLLGYRSVVTHITSILQLLLTNLHHLKRNLEPISHLKNLNIRLALALPNPDSIHKNHKHPVAVSNSLCNSLCLSTHLIRS